MHSVIETPAFLTAARAMRVSKEERVDMVNWIASNPSAGDLIEGTGGGRKVRFAGRSKGKKGGYRVITFGCPSR